VLFAHNVRVGPPGMPYLDDLDEEASLQVQILLRGCTSLEMMYDESDEYARNVLKQANVWVERYEDNKVAVVSEKVGVPREVAYLATHGVTHWLFMSKMPVYPNLAFLRKYRVTNWLFNWLNPRVRHDLSFLRKHRVESLGLCVAKPTDWRDCNFNHLVVWDTSIDCQAFPRLDAVEALKLNTRFWQDSTRDLVFNWKGLQNFPNMTHLLVRCNLSVRNARALVVELAGMHNLKWFCFDGKAPLLLLEGLQEVHHLARVEVNLQTSDYNDEDNATYKLMRFAKHGKHVALAASILLAIYLF